MLRKGFTGVVVGAVIAVGVIAGVDALRSSDEETRASTSTAETLASRPQASATTTTAENSASTPQPTHPFADIQGWIAYGDDEEIWAIDPTHGGRRKLIWLSDEPGWPVAWSRDGSKLLIVHSYFDGGRVTVSILNADGVEKRVVRMNGYFGSASLSPDGLKVVYSWIADSDPDAGIYLADADGGDVRLLKARHLRWYASEKRWFETELFAATFSPDGSQIAYVDGMFDWGNSIRVMDADGGHVRVLVDWRRGGRQKEAMDNHLDRLAWSPDGSRLAFDTDDGIWVVGSDGAGLRMLIRHGHNPTWSPNGSRFAYATWKEPESSNAEVQLRIADADGSHVQTFRIPWNFDDSWFRGPGPWNPLEAAGN